MPPSTRMFSPSMYDESSLTRLKRAEHEGQLPAGADAKRLAALFSTVLAGMAVMSKAGGTRKNFDDVVSAAMAVWPAESRQAARRVGKAVKAVKR